MHSIYRITLDDALPILAAARAKADEIGVKQTLCVVDESGNVIALHRIPGARLTGVDISIAKAFTGVWTAMPDVQWADHEHFMSEDGTRGVSQWTFRATNPDGTRTEVQGVDLFRIKDGRIVEKQAIRKQRPAIPAK